MYPHWLYHNVARPCSSNFQWRWYVHDPQKYFAVVGLTPAVWEWSSKWKTPAFARIILNQNGSYQDDDDVEGWNYNIFLGCDMLIACFGSALSKVNPSYLRAGNYPIRWYISGRARCSYHREGTCWEMLVACFGSARSNNATAAPDPLS